MRNGDCRKGQHRYADGSRFGAGLRRLSCSSCGSVTIDLTEAQAGLKSKPNLFVGEEERTSIFDGGFLQDLRSLSN